MVVISGSLPRSTENVIKIITGNRYASATSTGPFGLWLRKIKNENKLWTAWAHAKPLKAGTIMTEGANMQVKVPCMVL